MRQLQLGRITKTQAFGATGSPPEYTDENRTKCRARGFSDSHGVDTNVADINKTDILLVYTYIAPA